MGSGLDVKIFLLLQAAGVGQGVATPLVGAFYHHFLQSLSDRFLVRQRIPFGIDFYVRQRAGRIGAGGGAGGDTHVVPETGPINQGVKRGLAPN